MARTFIFIKDVEHFLKQGKTEMQLPQGSRFSPAAWDLIREKNIRCFEVSGAIEEAVKILFQ